METFNEIRREAQRERDSWGGFEPWMGDDDD